MENNEILNAEEIEVTEDGEVIENEDLSEQQKDGGCGKYVVAGGIIGLAFTAFTKYVLVPGGKKLRSWTKAKIAEAKEKKAAKTEAKEKKDSEETKEEK